MRYSAREHPAPPPRIHPRELYEPFQEPSTNATSIMVDDRIAMQ